MKQIYIILGLTISILSCTSLSQTKPNAPQPNILPIECNILAKENLLLIKELTKIPEIQDGISPIDELALKKICLLYMKNPLVFNSAFQKMYDEGIATVRKYCTPLQALYWIALKDQLELIDLSRYSLTRLLNEAWYKSGFDYDGTGRWDHFREVTERLNSPKLVDYYESRNFTYKKIRLRSLDDYKDPREIFRRKQGECWLYTAFSIYCLRKAGYEAYAITVHHGNYRQAPNHVSCEFLEKDGKKYILDNSLSTYYVHATGIFPQKVYLDIYPYYGKGYLTN